MLNWKTQQACLALWLLAGTANAAILDVPILSKVEFSGNANLGAPLSQLDKTADKGFSGTGFGGVDEQNQFWQFFFIGDDRGGNLDYATVIQVDIAALSGATINSAKLEWQFLDASSGSAPLEQRFSTFATNGTIGGAGTGISGVPGGAIQSSVFTTTFGLNRIDITAMVQQRVGAGSSWLGLYMEPVGDTEQFTTVGNDLNRADVFLRVDYTMLPPPAAVPEPTSIAIWGGLGWLGLIAARRRTAERRIGTAAA